MVASPNAWIYPYLIRRPDLTFTLTGENGFYHQGRRIGFEKPEDIAYICQHFDYVLLINMPHFPFLTSQKCLLSHPPRYDEHRGVEVEGIHLVEIIRRAPLGVNREGQASDPKK